MGKEFNLSKKIVSERPDKELVEVLFKNDVKEFIKRLKEHPMLTNMCSICAKEMNNKIDKLAGPKFA